MYYNSSAEVKAQEECKSKKNRDIAIALWIVLCTTLAAYNLGLFSELGGAMVFMVMPMIIAIMAIYSAVLYCRAHENIKERNKLRVGSRVLLIMSLAMLIFTVVLLVENIIEVDGYIIEHNLKGTSGASGPWMALLALVPISAALIISFLSFLVASIKLKRWSKKY